MCSFRGPPDSTNGGPLNRHIATNNSVSVWHARVTCTWHVPWTQQPGQRQRTNKAASDAKSKIMNAGLKNNSRQAKTYCGMRGRAVPDCVKSAICHSHFYYNVQLFPKRKQCPVLLWRQPFRVGNKTSIVLLIFQVVLFTQSYLNYFTL